MTPKQTDHVVEVLLRCKETLEKQHTHILALQAKNAVLEAHMTVLAHYTRVVMEHNKDCDAQCNSGNSCGYAGYLKRTGRRCIGCPAEFKVNVMPTLGNA